MWYAFMKKEIGNNSKLSEFSFYCRVCKTFFCRIYSHRLMAYNAKILSINNWEDFADENEVALRSEGHFDCPTYRRTHEQIKQSLLNKRLDQHIVKLRNVVTEIIIEEPQLSDRVTKEVDEVLNQHDKRRKLTLKEAALTSLSIAIVMFGLVGLLYI